MSYFFVEPIKYLKKLYCTIFDDYYRWVKVNKIEKVADYKYIVEIEYDSKVYRFNCQFNVVDNVLQDVIVKSLNK